MSTGGAARADSIDGRLTILCGGGNMPDLVAREAIAAGHDVFMLGIRGEADAAIERYPHAWIGYDEVGRFFDLLQQAGSRDLVMIGRIRRPDASELKFDFKFLSMLPKLLLSASGGDESLLSAVIGVIEGRGVRVHGAHDVAPGLVLGEGPLGKIRPGRQERADIAHARKVHGAVGAYDVGQAVVVRKGHVLAIEAAEGTDGMLKRCATLMQRYRGEAGVLLKLPKPGQELRTDMPVIGPETVAAVAEARLKGIAILAGATLVAGREETRQAADRAGLFITGLAPGATPGVASGDG